MLLGKNFAGGLVVIDSNFSINQTAINNNIRNLQGGCINVISVQSILQVSTTKFIDCQSQQGAIIYAESLGTVNINQSKFLLTQRYGSGGLICMNLVSNATTIYNSDFLNGVSDKGGAIFQKGGHMTLENVTVYHCNATMQGGGIYLDGYRTRDLWLKNCTFFDNLAFSQGGAISAEIFNVQVTNCTFEMNRVVGGRGGAVSFSVGGNEVEISLSEFRNNQVEGASNTASAGGAISVYGTNQLSGPGVTIESSNFSNNKGYLGGSISI